MLTPTINTQSIRMAILNPKNGIEMPNAKSTVQQIHRYTRCFLRLCSEKKAIMSNIREKHICTYMYIYMQIYRPHSDALSIYIHMYIYFDVFYLSLLLLQGILTVLCLRIPTLKKAEAFRVLGRFHGFDHENVWFQKPRPHSHLVSWDSPMLLL